MSLNIYRKQEEIPKGMTYVKGNDAFFDAQGVICNSKLGMDILQNIDKAEYINESAFKGRFGSEDIQPKANLSTGTKTLLNILQYPDYCFDVCECGVNALEELFKINTGNILWSKPFVWLGEETKCDICMHGVNYKDVFELFHKVKEEDGDV
jgi:hypothetical protein